MTTKTQNSLLVNKYLVYTYSHCLVEMGVYSNESDYMNLYYQDVIGQIINENQDFDSLDNEQELKSDFDINLNIDE